jgi:hypothetical protein
LAQLVAELGDAHDFADIVPTLLIERVDSHPSVSASEHARKRSDDWRHRQSGCVEYLGMDRRIGEHTNEALEDGNIGLYARGGCVSVPPRGQSCDSRMNTAAVFIEVSARKEWLSSVSDDAVRPPSHCLQCQAGRSLALARTGLPERGNVNDD